METIKTKDEFNVYLKLLKDRFSQVVDTKEFNWSNINSILMLSIKKNWTTESSNSNYQLNSDAVKDFFPILQISDSFPHWRLSMPAFISTAVLSEFAATKNSNDWIAAKISYRHKIQNSYPYLQLTLEDDLRALKNSLKENDEIYFVREQNTSNYFVFASRVKIFNKDSILIINPEMASADKTVFELDEIQQSDKATVQQDVNNVIYYGSPGTGKSHTADTITHGKKVQKVTFHPDYDYHSFVGGYKPTMDKDKIAYKFVPQIFTKIYVNAWKNFASADETEPFYLQIEEINRGNCAEIFGDLFQLLDRKSDGSSKYEVTAEEELYKYLISADGFGGEHDGIKGGKLRFPSNLKIIATMNTSDQSLFPMDSAFKRRWDWIYVPIDYNCSSSDFTIQLNNKKSFEWLSFLKIINEEIFEITKSQDKQIGNWFIDAQNSGKVISESTFVNKVIFYLWNDVFKDEENTIFKSADGKNLTYTSFFENGTSNNLVSYILEERLKLTDIIKAETTTTGEE